MVQSEVQHRDHVQLVAGRHDDEIGKRPEIRSVKGPVVRRAIGTRQAGAIQAERDRQVL